MSQRMSSFLFLLGIALVVLALWYLSYLVVRWDTRRRGVRPVVQKAWVAAAIALPLFGFALYLFTRVLERYLTPQENPDGGAGAGSAGSAFSPVLNLRGNGKVVSPGDEDARSGHSRSPEYLQRQVPMPEPAWGSTEPAHSNGKSHAYQTPETIRAPYQVLRVRYSLLTIQGPLTGQQFILKSLPALIGRGPDASVALDADLNVSRRHAEIYEWNGMLRIRDLGSMHGTQVNGAAVNDQALTSGDRVSMGGTVLILRELP